MSSGSTGPQWQAADAKQAARDYTHGNSMDKYIFSTIASLDLAPKPGFALDARFSLAASCALGIVDHDRDEKHTTSCCGAELMEARWKGANLQVVTRIGDEEEQNLMYGKLVHQCCSSWLLAPFDSCYFSVG